MRSVINQSMKIPRSFGKYEYEKISNELNEPSDPHTPRIPPPPLLILDLNGTLIYRKKPNSIIRPYVNEFFDYIFSKELIGSKEYPNWEVMIWSSAQKHNVRMMCDLLGIEKRESSVTKINSMNSNHHHQTGSKDDILSNFENLTVQSNDRIPQSNHHRDLNIKRSVIEIWDRSQMNLSQKDFNRKVSTTKDLNSIWSTIKYLDPYDQSEHQYGPKNTIIIDDSLEKLSLQPYNLCQIEEFKGSREDNELLEMIKTLKQIKLQSNFSSYLKHKKNQDQLSTNKLNDQEFQDRSES